MKRFILTLIGISLIVIISIYLLNKVKTVVKPEGNKKTGIKISKAHDIKNNKKESVETKRISNEIAVFAPIIANIKLSQEPRLNETVTATITVTFLDDISYIFRNKDEMIKNKTHDKFVKMWSKDLQWNKNIPRHMKLNLKSSEGVEILNGRGEIYWDMKKGETKSFDLDLRLNSPPVFIKGIIQWFFTKEKKGPYLLAPIKGVGFVLLNKKTGQLGTKKELEVLLNKLPEYRYDIILGKRENKWEFCPQEEVEMLRETLPNSALKSLVKIQEQIKEIQMLDSTITDLEILEMLHDMEYEMLVRYGISDGKEARDILLKARKLSIKTGLSKWKAVEKVSGKKSLLHDQ